MTTIEPHNRANPWDSQTKADAIARLMLGERPYDVAKALGVPHWTVKSWHKNLPQYRDEMLARLIDREEFGVLISDFLRAGLTNVTQVLETTSNNPEWILRQEARDLATYVDILTNRITAIAAALGGQSTAEPKRLEIEED